MQVIKIALKPVNDGITDARYQVVKLENAIRVAAGSKEFRVGDNLTESEAEKLLQGRHNKVTVTA